MTITLKRLKANSYAVIICAVYLLMLFIRMRVGYLTPDERLFISGAIADRAHAHHLQFGITNASGINAGTDAVPLKYYITSKIFAAAYVVNEHFVLCVNILLSTSVCWYLMKRTARKGESVSLFVLFLAPGMVFFCVSYLRDIYVVLAGVLLLWLPLKHKTFKGRSLMIVASLVLRPEIGVIYGGAYYLSRSRYPFYKVFTACGAIGLLICIVYSPCYEWYIARYIDSPYTRGLGLLEWEYSRFNVVIASIANGVVFYSNRFFMENVSLFDYYMSLHNGVVMAVITLSYVRWRKCAPWHDRRYRMALYVVMLSIVVANFEADIRASIRHSLPFLPFWFYLAFPSRSINSRRDIDIRQEA